jgi:hypothetical protein
MRTNAETIAGSLAAARDIAPARSDQTARAAAAAATQFADILTDTAAAQVADTSTDAAPARHSAAWEDFYSHPVIGVSDDGLPIVGETEAERAKTLATYAKIATAHGLDPQPTMTIQARLPVTDGLMGPKLGYHQVTLAQLPVALTQASLTTPLHSPTPDAG